MVWSSAMTMRFLLLGGFIGSVPIHGLHEN